MALEADTVVILSSELIAKITQEYFNKTMFKQRVEIVDLKPTETGYMFSIAFVVDRKQVVNGNQGFTAYPPTGDIEHTYTSPHEDEIQGVTASTRNKNGRFAKVKG